MTPVSRPRRTAALGLLVLMAAWSGPVRAATAHDHGHDRAHVHGLVALEVALDGPTLTIGLEAPLDSLLGFERPPRSAAERQAAEALLRHLRSGQDVFAPDAAGQCTLTAATAESEALQPGAKAGEHADLDATFTYTCAQPQALRRLDVGALLDRYRRVGQIDAQIVTPAGQFKQTLRRPARVLTWGR